MQADAPAALDTDDAALAVAAGGVAEGQVANLNLFAAHELDAEGIAGLDDDTGVALATYEHPLVVLDYELASVEHCLAGDALSHVGEAGLPLAAPFEVVVLLVPPCFVVEQGREIDFGVFGYQDIAA